MFLVPADLRLEVLRLATAKEESAAEGRRVNGRIKIHNFNEFAPDPHWNVVMRLKSLIIQVFARDIVNNHSPEDASAILFAHQRHGNGSGELGDYLRDLPQTQA